MNAWMLALALTAQQETPQRSLEWRLYCAAMRAAETSLRLHETDQVARWLSEAPPEHRGFEHRHIEHLASRSAASFALHAASITDLAVSPDGKLLATACGDGTARIVDALSGATIHELRGPQAAVWSPEFSPDGTRLATACSDGRTRVYEVPSGRELAALAGPGKGVAALAFGPAGLLAVCSWDRNAERGVWGIVELWDSASGQRLEHLEHGVKPIAAIDFNAEGTLLAAGTWDGDVALWTVGEWNAPRRLFPPKNDDYQAVRDLAFAPAGDELAVSYADGRARLFDARSQGLLHTLDTTAPGIVKELNDVCYLPDGARLATVGADLTLRLWERASGKLLAEYSGHTRSVQSVVAHPEGTRLYSASADGSVRAWDLAALEPARSVWRGPSSSYSLALSPDGARAATTGWGGFVRIVEVESGRELARWNGHQTSGVGVDWSPDGRFLSTTGNDGRIVLWDAATQTELKVLADHEGQVLASAFSPDGKLVAGAGNGGDVCLWSVPEGARVATLADAPGRVDYMLFSPDGTRLAAGHPDGIVRLWNLATHELAARLEGHRPGQLALAFHPLEDVLVSAGGRSVRRFDAHTGKALSALPEASSNVLHLSFAPDGRRLAAGLGNGDLEVWDAQSGEVLLRHPYSAGVFFTRWSRNGDALFALPMDETVRVLRTR